MTFCVSHRRSDLNCYITYFINIQLCFQLYCLACDISYILLSMKTKKNAQSLQQNNLNEKRTFFLHISIGSIRLSFRNLYRLSDLL